MNYNCKRQFTAFLRKCKVDYITERDQVSIGNFHLCFFDDFDTVTIITPICPNLTHSIHYASPETMYGKLLEYKQLVKTFLAYKEAATFKGHSIIGLS
jgi:hypothetical protein